MKQEVGKAAAVRVKSGSIVGWVRGQQRRIQFSFERSPQIGEIKDIGVPTSFQAEVLLSSTASLDHPGCNRSH